MIKIIQVFLKCCLYKKDCQTNKRSYKNGSFIALLFCALILPGVLKSANIVLENADITYSINEKGQNVSFTDKKSGINYLRQDTISYCASLVQAGKEYFVTYASIKGNLLKLTFKNAGATVDILISKGKDNFFLEVLNVTGSFESLTFLNVPLQLKGLSDEPFAACVIPMNVFTHVREIPVLQTNLQATCYQRFGMKGAKISLIAVPPSNILAVMREVMKENKDIPYSTAGGAWGKLSKEGYGSYLMNFGTLTEKTTDEWIKTCQDLGFNQIDSHGGGKGFFRFGDFELDPQNWPGGWNSFKQINRKLHAAGISSIFHTYAFFIDKTSKYVTPVPSEDLGYFRSFTLAEPLSKDATEITVKEPTDSISFITGFFVRNSLTLRIGKELIEFSGVSKAPPYKFTGCKRGVDGTTVSSHSSNEKAYHLREMFGRFVPGGETPLFDEIARRTAEIVNKADFDGIYLDAIDGSDIIAGEENFWYYGGKFVVEVAKHLKQPVGVGMEMSSMINLWWNYRSRWQAWDKPVRGYKRFIDIHLASIKSHETEHGLWRGDTSMINKLAPLENSPLLLPLHLGWWSQQTWNPPQVEPVFSDDIEYLGCKMIGNNAGLSMTSGADKKTLDENPVFKRLNAIIKQYEELRHSNYFSDSIRKILRQPGKEFKLIHQTNGRWNFAPVNYQKHKISGLDHPSASWKVHNEFKPQPVKLRIEPLMSVKGYDDPSNIVLGDFSQIKDFINPETAKGVIGSLEETEEKLPNGESAIAFSATSSGESPRTSSWIKMEKKFEPSLNLEKNQALGVWIKGDGNGELLNIRLESPHYISHGARGDHFIKIDFKGWKYFDLVEIESTDFSNYSWPAPFSSSSFYVYDSYRHEVSFNNIDKIQLWYNNLPPGKTVTCLVGSIKALPLVSVSITNPSIIIGGEKIMFPVKMESGMYLELQSDRNCKLYGSKGELLKEVTIVGRIPTFKTGTNEFKFVCDNPENVHVRAQVTVIGEGKSLSD
ncbi:MAG: hypothetical protein ABI288_00725 [Ginsengibacter sp.]